MEKSSIGKVVTVLGSVLPEKLGITDAHNHMWIEPVEGSDPSTPVLIDQSNIRAELIEYHQAGGGCQIDCQPGGSGRDGNRLSSLSRATRVHIVACTGAHLPNYYPDNYWIFSAEAEKISPYFISEIEQNLRECNNDGAKITAGFIKIACPSTLAKSPLNIMEAAVESSKKTGTAIQVHTEKGSSAEDFVKFFKIQGLPITRLILCHMDKRPDLGLHSELAAEGVVLEYDTFFRPKYHPDETVWPLIPKMVAKGFSNSIALATDLAESSLWNYLGGGPGLVGFINTIRKRLFTLNFSEKQVDDLTGGNICRRMAIVQPF